MVAGPLQNYRQKAMKFHIGGFYCKISHKVSGYRSCVAEGLNLLGYFTVLAWEVTDVFKDSSAFFLELLDPPNEGTTILQNTRNCSS
jgi:hypothetical protein